MSRGIEELEKRVEHLESELDLLKELVKLQSKAQERYVPTYPPTPLNPYYGGTALLSHPFEPPYKITCGGEE